MKASGLVGTSVVALEDLGTVPFGGMTRKNITKKKTKEGGILMETAG